jgi:hypothetical protein
VHSASIVIANLFVRPVGDATEQWETAMLRSNLVNLDAMIKREDFAAKDGDDFTVENVQSISIRDFTQGGLLGPSLRKPDFQRETNHWSPDQVVSLLQCFVNGDLIPSVILWQSPSYLFVIDGGHRLSVLKAWVEDDYGDGPTSQQFFGFTISSEQKKTAARTRELVAKQVGTWQHHQARVEKENLDSAERRKLTTLASRALQIQWVKGDADKAESSFFKINTKGTPLDKIEEMLLQSRRKPISIAARALIRAGTGHRYWSRFPEENAKPIEELAKSLHGLLFDPELKTPVKTLDLPLGGPKGVRAALQVLIELILIAARNQQGEPKDLDSGDDDADGSSTVAVLKRTLTLVKRVTGNDKGSLGLHPAVYFYGPTGRHSSAMFMGTMLLIARKLSNNDSRFFAKFSRVRAELETRLINYKELIASMLQKHVSHRRVGKYADMLDGMIERLDVGLDIADLDLVELADLSGKIVVGTNNDAPRDFSEETRSRAFITTTLAQAVKCPICGGYLDAAKSVSYDHKIPVRDGGRGHDENCQLTHPYCNQSVKQ